jgi:hypothetical protein
MAKTIKAKIVKKNGGYLFPQLGIHVVAKSEDDARKLVKKYHGIDPDTAVLEQSDNINSEKKQSGVG